MHTTLQKPLSEKEQYELYKKLCHACSNTQSAAQLKQEILGLLQQGAPTICPMPYQKSDIGTCLFALLYNDHLNLDEFKELFSLLYKHGADVQITSGCGNNLLQYAALLDRAAQVRWFAETFNIDVKNDYGNTALHLAARYNCFATVQCLLELGANPRIRNDKDRLAGDLTKWDKIHELLPTDACYNKQVRYSLRELLAYPKLMFRQPKACLKAIINQHRPGLKL